MTYQEENDKISFLEETILNILKNKESLKPEILLLEMCANPEFSKMREELGDECMNRLLKLARYRLAKCNRFHENHDYDISTLSVKITFSLQSQFIRDEKKIVPKDSDSQHYYL